MLGSERWMQSRGLRRGRKRGPLSCAGRMLRLLESSSGISRDNLGEGSRDEVTGFLGLLVAGGVVSSGTSSAERQQGGERAHPWAGSLRSGG